MNRKRIFWIILLCLTASLDICLAHRLELEHGFLREKSQLADTENASAVLRSFKLPYEESKKPDMDPEDLLAYLFCQSDDPAELKQWKKREQPAEPAVYEEYVSIIKKLLADAVYFPVPEAVDDKKAAVSFENSWQYERTYGGSRGHEGCDIMAGIQKRGYYPIVSCSDGIVEKMGWLSQGGYRIGIRSPGGVYYYYAHLAEYEDGITEGSAITAGQLIGYMGDTGYSEIEGTTGNFPVHLHFGMYLNDQEGREISYNPYYLLKRLENSKLRYIYKQAD